MSPASLPTDEQEMLAQTLSSLVDGRLSSDEQTALESRLLRDRAARDEFRDFMQTECLLRWEVAYGDERLTAPIAPVARPPWRHAAIWLLPLALGACSIALVGWLFRPGVAAIAPAATLTDVTNARWHRSPALVRGAAIPVGPVRLEAGSAQVTFASGAVVALNAPAEIEVLGPNRVFLRDGRIIPFVPPSAKGFTVVSPSSEVVDFGTEFSIGVDASGQTDVYVIDGEVDVRRSLAGNAIPVRMTQGFGARVPVGNTAPTPSLSPVLVDHFEGAAQGLARLDIGAASKDLQSVVRDGSLWVPFATSDRLTRSTLSVVLQHDFSKLRGRRSTIAFKATTSPFSNEQAASWVALVLDDCRDRSAMVPAAWEASASAAILVSSKWQAGVRVAGEPVAQSRVFARNEDAVGPYQVVVSIDDSPVAHDRRGGTTLDVAINGLEIVRDRRISLSDSPRLSLQTFQANAASDCGYARIDDLSVSMELSGDDAEADHDG